MDFESLFDYDSNESESLIYAGESTFESDFENAEVELTLAAESQYFIDSIMTTFDDLNEFVDYVTENASYWEAYNLIDNAEAVVEAVKRIQIDDWKQVNFKRLVHRECIRIEARKDSPDWKNFVKYRAKYREYRDKIIERNKSKATQNVRQSMRNSKNKASSMKTSNGNDVKKRLEASMASSNAGKNPNRQGKPANGGRNLKK